MRLDYSLCTEEFFREHVLGFKLLQTTSGSDHVPSVLTLSTSVFTPVELSLKERHASPRCCEAIFMSSMMRPLTTCWASVPQVFTNLLVFPKALNFFGTSNVHDFVNAKVVKSIWTISRLKERN